MAGTCAVWQQHGRLSEIGAFWVNITLCGFKGKSKLGGTQELEPVLANEGIGFLVVVIAVTISRVERQMSFMGNSASEVLCDIAPSTFEN